MMSLGAIYDKHTDIEQGYLTLDRAIEGSDGDYDGHLNFERVPLVLFMHRC